MLSDWRIYALGSAIFAGLTAVLAKVGVSGLPSNTATLIRTIVIIMFLIALVALRGEWVVMSYNTCKSNLEKIMV